MANRWTGGFDAAIELAPSGANSLLAAIHRKGHVPAGEVHPGPHLLHSLALNLPLPGSSAAHGLKGHLKVQVSTPSVSIPDGAAGRVVVASEVYARFQAVPGSKPAPEFLHGILRFTTPIAIVECENTALAEIRVGSNAVEVSFTPLPGTTLTDEQRQLVEDAVRDVLAEAVGAVHHRISGVGSGEFTIEHIAFRTQRTGSLSAFELLLAFGEEGAPAPQPGSPAEIFIGPGEDLALALGGDFLSKKLLEAARGPLTGIEVGGSQSLLIGSVSFHAAPDPETLTVELRQGVLRASIDGSGSLSPGGSFRFRLRQDFGITTSGGDLTLTLAGGPSLDITQGNTLLHVVFGIFKGLILDKIEAAASGVVQVASAQLNELVDRSIEDLTTELGAPGVSLQLRRATIDQDAVVLGAAVDLGGTKPAVASFTNAIEATAATSVSVLGITKFDAFESWIPGGTVLGYRWIQLGAGDVIVSQQDEPHRFVLRLVPDTLTDGSSAGEYYGWPPIRWCLEVRGTQFVGAFDPLQVTRTVCGLSVVVPNLDLALDADLLTIQVPDEQGGALVDLAPWSRYRAHAFAGHSENRGYLLLHRAGSGAGEAAAILRKALSGPLRKAPIFATLVVKDGKSGNTGRASSRELAGIAFTNDPREAWCKRFRLDREGTTVLLGPGGKEIWRDGGPLRLERLLDVLKKLDLDGARPPRRTPVSLALGLGIVAPDFFFQCTPPVATSDFTMSTSKLRGQDLELCFWTTWSDASLAELRRRAAPTRPADGPRTVFVNDGEDPELAARFLKQHGLAFEHTATDPHRGISRRYGISCWPTVVRLDAEGRVAAARFGLEHAHACEKSTGGAAPEQKTRY
jgi:hypothetical protein